MPHFEELYAQVNSPPPVFESTGVLAGGALSINAGDNTKFDMAAGVYAFADYTYNPAGPARSVFVKEAVTAQTVTNIGTQLVTYVGVDSNGDIVQSSVPFTNSQRRTIAQVGVLVHTNLTSLNAVNDIAAPVRQGISQLFDLMTAIGPMNVSGNTVGANGANLSIDKSAGTVFKLGCNFQTDPLNPHLRDQAALTAPTNLRYRLSDDTEYPDTAFLDPTNYESPLGTLVNLSGPNKFSVQRIALFTSNLIRIQYGQTEYNSMAEAEAAIATQSFVTESNIAENGVLIAYVILRRSTTDLTVTTDAKFLMVGKFGSVSSGGQVLTSTDDLPEGVINLYFTDARAQAAAVTASITNGDTTHAPSGDAVFDALALKADLAGAAFTGPISTTGGLTTGADAVVVDAGVVVRRMKFRTSGVDRWQIGATATPETGSNVGSDFAIQRHTDGGVAIDVPLTIFRSTGTTVLLSATNAGTLQATKIGATAVTPNWQLNGAGTTLGPTNSIFSTHRWQNNANSGGLLINKSRGGTTGTHTVVATNDSLGTVGFNGSDGAAFFEAARIEALCSSTPASGSVPGMLVLSTTPIGGGSALAALTLNNDQSALFAAAVTAPTTLVVGNTASIPANTRALIDRIGSGTLPALPGGTSLTLQGNNAASNNNYLVNIAGTTGQAGIRFGDSGSASQGRLDYDNNTDVFEISTNATLRATVNATGILLATGHGLSGASIYNTYTPTLTAVTNVSASSANISGWIRIGNAVLVFTSISVTATTAGLLTEIRVSLPVASNLGASAQLVGTGAIWHTNTEVASVGIQGDSVNDAALVRFVAPIGGASRAYPLVFGYIVI